MTDLTDEQYATVELIEAALEATTDGMTPSAAARRARTTTTDAAALLAWMVDHQYAHTSGNGAWTRYYAGRAR